MTTSPVRGVFWMLVSGLLFVLVTALVKLLEGRVPAAEAAFLRYVLGLVFLIPLWRSVRETRLTPRAWRLAILRGASHSIGVSLWFFAMSRLPLAEVTALNYLTPIYVTLGAAIFLGERLAIRRLAAIAIAFCGALVILRPGVQTLEIAHFAMLATALFFAVSYLIAKQLSAEYSPQMVVFLLSISVTIGLIPLALPVWITPSFYEIAILTFVALVATLGHYTMTLAFKAAPISVTQPATFLQLVWSGLIGVFVFHEAVDIYVIAGGTIIVAAVSFMSFREMQLLKKAITPVNVETKL